MFSENIQAVLAVYWPVPAGLLVLFCTAAFNFYRVRRPIPAIAHDKVERLAHRARA